jgi:hypothetical protein
MDEIATSRQVDLELVNTTAFCAIWLGATDKNASDL